MRVSFVKVPLKSKSFSNCSNEIDEIDICDKEEFLERICFNVGREIYVYDYRQDLLLIIKVFLYFLEVLTILLILVIL